jgi:hypothetical protein
VRVGLGMETKAWDGSCQRGRRILRGFEMIMQCLRNQRLKPTFTIKSKCREGSPALTFSVRIEEWLLKEHGSEGAVRKRARIVNFGSWIED